MEIDNAANEIVYTHSIGTLLLSVWIFMIIAGNVKWFKVSVKTEQPIVVFMTPICTQHVISPSPGVYDG